MDTLDVCNVCHIYLYLKYPVQCVYAQIHNRAWQLGSLEKTQPPTQGLTLPTKLQELGMVVSSLHLLPSSFKEGKVATVELHYFFHIEISKVIFSQ